MRRLELEMCLNAAPDMEQVEASFESALESELPAQLKVHYLGLHFALFFLVLTFALLLPLHCSQYEGSSVQNCDSQVGFSQRKMCFLEENSDDIKK